MTIPLVKEPEDTPFGNERCHFCKAVTIHWHENTNNPVCPVCAPRHKVAELPDHGQWIRTTKRRLRAKASQ